MKVVIDTVSLVNLCFIEIGDFRAIEWLINEFDVLTTSKVYKDGLSYINQSDDEEAHDIYTTKISEIRYDENSCNKYVDQVLSEVEESQEVDRGEKTALSLALRLSMRDSIYVVFVTDDYKALGPISEVLADHGCGVAVTGFYVIRQIGMLNSRHISIEEIEIASRSLMSGVRDSDEGTHTLQKPEKLFVQSFERINNLRGKGAARSQCRNL